MPGEYQVRLDIFEGPLDLLLYLVRKEEVELYDLSLERITRQYLDYLNAATQPDLDLAGDFIAMAAHLIYLKSRRLLPPDQQSPADDSAEEEDPRWELIRQLIEYKKFKEAAGHLQAAELARSDLFGRPPADPAAQADSHPEEIAATMALNDVGLLDLLNAFQRVLRRFETQQQAPVERTIYQENYTVADKIESLRALMAAGGGEPVTFSSLFVGVASRVELVVTFLALLELVRLKNLRIVQAAPFEEIQILGRAEESSPSEPVDAA
jgi:segregation and condensation protein A